MTVEFLPFFSSPRSITDELSLALAKSHSVTGSVAFWTLPPDFLAGNLLDALSRQGSSVCVDFQRPTDFTKLTDWVKRLSRFRTDPVIYLCVRQAATSRTEQESTGLLHTKIWLFDMGSGAWEIWVGSHNATRSALEGLNLEGTVCIRGHASEPDFQPLLDRVRAYLTYIRRCCEPFDPGRILVYQSLRGDVNEADLKNLLSDWLSARIGIEHIFIGRVLSFQGDSVDNLAGSTIILLGNLAEELSFIRHLNRGGSPVFVRILERSTGLQHHYEGRMRASDVIDDAFSENVAFNQRRWAVRRATRAGQAVEPPVLQEIRDVNRSLIHENSYFLNVKLIKRLSQSGRDVWYYTYPETNPSRLWRTVRPERPYQRLDDWGLLETNVYSAESEPYQVPVENVTDLVHLLPVTWSAGFSDALLERRVVIVGKPLDEPLL